MYIFNNKYTYIADDDLFFFFGKQADDDLVLPHLYTHLLLVVLSKIINIYYYIPLA